MPIHNRDNDEPKMKVVTNVGGEWVDLEATDFRHREYKRNQQTEPRVKYVVQPLPGQFNNQPPTQTDEPEDSPVEVDDELQAAIKEDLRKRGVSNKPKEIKIQKPKPKTTLD